MTFAQILPLIYKLDELKLDTKNQNQSADTGQLELTDLTENHILYDVHIFQFFLAPDYESMQSEEIRHVWHFEPILGKYIVFK